MYYSWKLSPFDTKILGLKTAMITYVHHQSIRDLQKELKIENIEYATYRIPANDYSTIQRLEENGFLLVDGLVSLEKLLVTQSINSHLVSAAVQEDETQLISMARVIFRGVSRYYHDPVIVREKGDTLYQEWMRNSLNGKVSDLVLVWKENGIVLGFITLQKKGQIPLVGVSEKARGKGVGQGLINAALGTFKSWGLKKVRIETQMTNVAALRLYHSCGFKVVDSSLTFRWHSSSS